MRNVKAPKKPLLFYCNYDQIRYLGSIVSWIILALYIYKSKTIVLERFGLIISLMIMDIRFVAVA